MKLFKRILCQLTGGHKPGKIQYGFVKVRHKRSGKRKKNKRYRLLKIAFMVCEKCGEKRTKILKNED